LLEPRTIFASPQHGPRPLPEKSIVTDAGGNPDSNTLLSDYTTVICLDDYHCLDRNGRKEKGVTALAPEAQDFDLMYEQVKALKEGKAVQKPIYNHVTGLLDPPEEIVAPKATPLLPSLASRFPN
jgi:pantothenate kinase